jgi:hypothetical protein
MLLRLLLLITVCMGLSVVLFHLLCRPVDRRVERGAAAIDTVESRGRCRAVGRSKFVAQCGDGLFELFSFLFVVLLVCCR